MVNVSLGVLGHVDSGKTSLCKTLSTTGSTAAFDSNPQSIQRGITLDLGFSSFKLGEKWNFTLVDCPGHASLIRTVIGGSQIMDIMLLVVDINKGMQPQTAECLILAQITSQHLIVLLNKVDLVPETERPQKIAKLRKLMTGALRKSKFGDAPILPVSAVDPSIGTQALKEALLRKVETTEFKRDRQGPFLMAVDHCFSKKGQGTVLTGTVLRGSLKLNDVFEIPILGDTKKVKSMQSFHVPIQEASAGDRVGVCVPGLDASFIERTIIAAPKSVHSLVRVAVISVDRIPFFKQPIKSKRRYHISMGYATTTAKVVLFKPLTPSETYNPAEAQEFVAEIQENDMSPPGTFFAVLEFDSLAMVIPKGLLIGSDLQSDVGSCRLAFSGSFLAFSEDKDYVSSFLPTIRILRWKEKLGSVDRLHSPTALIVRGFSKRETSLQYLLNLHVHVNLPDHTSLQGTIQSRFGQTNKLRVELKEPLTPEQTTLLIAEPAPVILRYATHFFNGSGPNKIQQ